MLNLPVVGRILRKGGAFFLRRSFRSNKLYSAVFNEYFARILANGTAIEYFIEGTRSRTGRLLPARLGLLKMTGLSPVSILLGKSTSRLLGALTVLVMGGSQGARFLNTVCPPALARAAQAA